MRALALRVGIVVVVTGVMNQVGEIHTLMRKVLGQVPVKERPADFQDYLQSTEKESYVDLHCFSRSLMGAITSFASCRINRADIDDGLPVMDSDIVPRPAEGVDI